MRSDEREEIARAVSSRTDKLRVYDKNGKPNEAAWPKVLPDWPYAVYLAENGVFVTVAFDFDTSKGDAQGDAAELGEMLEELQVSFVSAVSGPSGGRHVLVHAQNGARAKVVDDLARVASRRFASLDISMLCNPTTGAIRPPGSPHMKGGESVSDHDVQLTVDLLSYGCNESVFVALTERLRKDLPPPPPKVTVALPEPSNRARIPERVRELLRQGDTTGRFPSRSELIHSIACSYVWAGASMERLQRDLLDPANVAGEKLREMRSAPGGGSGDRWLETTWVNAQTFVSEHADAPTQNLDPEREQLGGLIFSPEFSGRKGFTDRLILAAHARIALSIGSLTYRASIRQIAESAGLNRSLIPDAHRRFEESGILTKGSSGDIHEAQGWTLSPQGPTGVGGPVFLLGDDRDIQALDRLIEHLGHDAFRHTGGLGAIAQLTWAALDDNPQTVKELRVRTGASIRTLRATLRTLGAQKMARRSKGRWTRLEAPLDPISESLGTAGRRAADKQLYQLERAEWLRVYDNHITERDAGARKRSTRPPTLGAIRRRLNEEYDNATLRRSVTGLTMPGRDNSWPRSLLGMPAYLGS